MFFRQLVCRYTTANSTNTTRTRRSNRRSNKQMADSNTTGRRRSIPPRPHGTTSSNYLSSINTTNRNSRINRTSRATNKEGTRRANSRRPRTAAVRP